MIKKEWMVGSSIVSVGPFTYGADKIKVCQWGEGYSLHCGSFCSIAGGVLVYLGGNHRVDWLSTFPFGHKHHNVFGEHKELGHPHSSGDVKIENDVWIGQYATIMSGVNIGDGAVVGAHSVVAKDVAPYSIVVGNPAKVIRKRFDDEIIHLLLELRWWELDIDSIKLIRNDLNKEPDINVLRNWIQMFRNTPPDA